MPGLDRSGPMGAGPMTGGRRGLCGRSGRSAGFSGRGNVEYGSGLNFRRGRGSRLGFNRGYGRGFGRGAYGAAYGYSSSDTPMGTVEELEMLRAEADDMRKTMEAINNKINALEKENNE